MRLQIFVTLVALLNVGSARALASQANVVTITADGPARDTLVGGTLRRTFTITQTSGEIGSYGVTCTAVGAVTCVGTDRATVRIAPGQQTTVLVDYRTVSAGQGLLVLRLRDIGSGARAKSGVLITVTN